MAGGIQREDPALLAFAQRRFVPLAPDGDGGGLDQRADQAAKNLGHCHRLARIGGEGAEHAAVGIEDGGRPAGSEAMPPGQREVRRPQGVVGDVIDVHRRPSRRCRAATADAFADLEAVDRHVVFVGQAGRRAVAQMNAVRVEQQDRGEDALVLGFNEAAERFQRDIEQGVAGDAFEDSVVGRHQGVCLVGGRDVADNGGDELPAADRHGASRNVRYLDRAVLAPVTVLQLSAASLENASCDGAYPSFVEIGLKVGELEGGKFLARVAEAEAAGIVELGEAQCFRIDKEDAVAGVGNDRPVKFLAGGQRGQCLLTLGDVEHVNEQVRLVVELDDARGEADVVALASPADADAVVIGDGTLLAQHGHHAGTIVSVPPKPGLQGRHAEQLLARPFVFLQQALVRLDEQAVAHARDAGGNRCGLEGRGKADLQLLQRQLRILFGGAVENEAQHQRLALEFDDTCGNADKMRVSAAIDQHRFVIGDAASGTHGLAEGGS